MPRDPAIRGAVAGRKDEGKDGDGDKARSAGDSGGGDETGSDTDAEKEDGGHGHAHSHQHGHGHHHGNHGHHKHHAHGKAGKHGGHKHGHKGKNGHGHSHKHGHKHRHKGSDSESSGSDSGSDSGTDSGSGTGSDSKDAPEEKRPGAEQSWGTHGILRESNLFDKKNEFRVWALDLKKVDVDSLPMGKQKDLFREYAEDFNTSTFPSEKYYDLDAWEKQTMAERAQQQAELARKGRLPWQKERTTFNDEEERRMERRAEKERIKRIEALQEGLSVAYNVQTRELDALSKALSVTLPGTR